MMINICLIKNKVVYLHRCFVKVYKVMFKKEDFCTQKTSMFLKDAGFNDICRYAYCNVYRVRDEIIEKHPGLSDCGYQDLTQDFGGPYRINEVYGHYIEVVERTMRNSTIDKDMNEICTAPTLQEAIIWILEKYNVLVSSKPYICEDGIKWLVEIRDIGIDKVSLIKTITCKDNYCDATNAGIEYVVINCNNI